MSLQLPLALFGLLPLAGVAALLWRRAPGLVPALPGAWARIVDPPLQRFLARDMVRPGVGQVWLALAAALCLVVAVARPVVPLGTATDFANLTGRVLVIDADRPGIAARRIAADQILATAPEVPTAMIALAGEAYLVVPFTTDARQIDRYLQVLTPEQMPAPGRAIQSGLSLAERVLADAGVVAGQIVVIAGGTATDETVDLPESDTLRAILATDGAEGWDRIADAYDAPLGDVAAIDADLDRAVARLSADLPGAAYDLAPWFFGLAALLCLALFRRRRAE